MELTTTQLIMIIIGALVVVVVLLGIGFYFKNNFIEFFKNIPTWKIILGSIK